MIKIMGCHQQLHGLSVTGGVCVASVGSTHGLEVPRSGSLCYRSSVQGDWGITEMAGWLSQSAPLPEWIVLLTLGRPPYMYFVRLTFHQVATSGMEMFDGSTPPPECQ